MRLSQVAIDRPVLSTVLSLLIVLFGLLSLGRLPNRELPDVDPPVVTVTTVYPGAAPEVVETSVTQVLEDEIVAIEGIEHVTSISREQVSVVTVEFELGRDVDLAANDVRDRIGRARGELPDEVEEPIVAKREADASPILWLGISSPRLDQIELSTIADTQVKDRLTKLPGVSDVIIGGERRFSMRVWVDNPRLTAHGLTIADVARALAAENVEIPSGRIEGTGRELTVRTLGELDTARGFGDLIVAERQGSPIRLRDVARVEVGAEDDRKIVRYNGLPAVGLGVVRQSKANTLDVADAVAAEIAKLREELPETVEISTAFDSSVFIRRSIEDVTRTIAEAVVLVVLVIFLFLRSFRATLIPAIAIPISIVGAFSVLELLGYSINTLTLMGLTLAIGLVVDDAIVVLENVARWIEEGHPPLEAARRGMAEISFAVVAATVSVVAVFLPLAFLSDTTGRLFREFGITVAAAVAISGFVALTLSPMLCARLLRPKRPERGLRARLARGIEGATAGYTRLLRPALRWRGATLLLAVLWFGLGVFLFRTADREFIPTADRGNILAFFRGPQGATLEYTDRYVRQVEEIFQAVPEIEKVFSVIALGLGTPGQVNEGAAFSTLLPWEERERSQQEIVESLREQLWEVPGFLAFPLNPPPLGQSAFDSPVQIVLQGPDASRLSELSAELAQRLTMVPGMVNPRTDLLVNKPELRIQIDRERASDLGVSVREVATALQILLGGLDLTTFKLRGETYKVMVRLEEEARREPRDVAGIYVRGRDGRLVPLASVVRLETGAAPSELPHYDRARAATVSAGLARGVPLGDVLERAQGIAAEVLADAPAYRQTLSGESEDFYESTAALTFAYGLAIVIIYLVLAAQFESFVDPLTVLLAVALSFTGALVALRLTGDTLNLFSQIGLVLLVGLVTKNSILIVEFANQLRERGLPLEQAVFDAARLRFRPILMTALSTVLGIMPIALGLGAGGESRAPLGIAVAGGMFFSMTLTIFVVPAAHLVVGRLAARFGTSRVPAEELAGA